jgi:hypothetical protein
MNLHLNVFRSFFTKTVIASAALGGFLLLAGAPGAKANAWDDCNRRASYTDMRYHEALERYGPYSGQARHWAHERNEAFERRERLMRERGHYRDHDRDDRYYRDYDRR